jgi:hypothetical protein
MDMSNTLSLRKTLVGPRRFQSVVHIKTWLSRLQPVALLTWLSQWRLVSASCSVLVIVLSLSFVPLLESTVNIMLVVASIIKIPMFHVLQV